MKCKMTILCEDQAKMGFLDKKYSGQHGLSIFLEAGVNILFDTGPSDVLLKNARTASVDLADIDWIVLSHGHWDHADGLVALAEKNIRARLLCHPDVFVDRRKPTGQFNGAAMKREEASAKFELTESVEPFSIAPDIWFLGQVPRENDFEAISTPFHFYQDGEKHPDYLYDDTALALKTEKGLAVVTGCSHAGVCNICEYAKKVSGQDRLHMVLGGFHLLEDSEALEKTVDYFEKERPDHLYPMHCTALPALSKFYEAFRIEKLCAGDVISLEA